LVIPDKVLIVQLLTKIQTKEQYNTLMEAIIKFDLNDPDDTRNHLRCIKALDMACVLWEIRNMRKELEWMEEQGELSSESVMTKILEHFDNHNINVDELMQ